VQILIIVALMTIIYRDADRSILAALALAALFPLTVVLTTPLLLNALRACFGGKVNWRGNLVRA